MNIRFEKITIHHFLSYDHAEITLEDKGFCLVRGINRNPKDSAKSNGSGKSTIFNAISYALTGETLQGLKSNLANINYNDGCWVRLDFTVDGHSYVLVRSRDDEQFGTDLKIIIDGEDRSGKGIRESSELLEQYLPDLTSELIGSVILIGQNMPMKFTANTPSGRKEVLEHLTQSDFMIQDLKSRIADRTDKLNGYIREQEDYILSDSSKESVLREQLTKSEQEYHDKYTDMKNYDGAIAKLESDVKDYTSALELANKALEEEKEKETKLNANLMANINQKQAKLFEVADDHNREATKLTETRATLQNELRTAESKLTEMQNIKDVCPLCHQKIPNVVKPDTAPQVALIEGLRAKLEDHNKVIAEDTDKYNKFVKEVTEAFDSGINKMKDELDECRANVRTLSSNYFDTNSKLLAAQSDLRNTITERDLYESNRQKLQDAIADYKTQIENLINHMNDVRERKATLDEHLAIVNKMSTIIKRDFRGFLLKNIIDYIDNKAKEYASKIFGCNEVAFTLDGNNIGISFCNKDYENLSGGEKQRLDLIIQFAIRDFISQYLDFSCNLLVLDEITDALDSESCEKVVDFIIEELSSIESVFIISHHADELELPQDSEILVEKTADGISRVVA